MTSPVETRTAEAVDKLLTLALMVREVLPPSRTLTLLEQGLKEFEAAIPAALERVPAARNGFEPEELSTVYRTGFKPMYAGKDWPHGKL